MKRVRILAAFGMMAVVAGLAPQDTISSASAMLPDCENQAMEFCRVHGPTNTWPDYITCFDQLSGTICGAFGAEIAAGDLSFL